MDNGLRIIDDYTQTQVFRAYPDTPWRPDAKRATLDLLCPDCRVREDNHYCPRHTPPEVSVSETDATTT